MERRDYPLFVVDTSRAHGRGREIDYVCCTDTECGFTASVEMLKEEDYTRLYDKNDYTSVWSDPHNGVRMYVSILSETPKDIGRTRSLLKRALKELLIRRKPVEINLEDVSNEAVVNFADVLMKQTEEHIRIDGEDKTDKIVMAVLNKIKKDYQ